MQKQMAQEKKYISKGGIYLTTYAIRSTHQGSHMGKKIHRMCVTSDGIRQVTWEEESSNSTSKDGWSKGLKDRNQGALPKNFRWTSKDRVDHNIITISMWEHICM